MHYIPPVFLPSTRLHPVATFSHISTFWAKIITRREEGSEEMREGGRDRKVAYLLQA